MLALLWIAFACATGAAANPREDAARVEALRASAERLEGRHVVVWLAPGSLAADEAAAFLRRADAGAAAILAHLGPHAGVEGPAGGRPELFIERDSPGPRVTGAAAPWIFLPAAQVRRGVSPYLHELVHVLAPWSWRRSEWAAEGFANHVAAAVVDDPAHRAAGGYHRSRILPRGLADLQALRCSPEGEAMRALVGVDGRRGRYAPGHAARFALTLEQRLRYAPPFYAQAWSFTDALVDAHGLDGFRNIATADDQDAAARALTGRSIDALRGDWWAALERDAPCASRAAVSPIASIVSRGVAVASAPIALGHVDLGSIRI